jgi:thiamine pyrophosphokinase
VRAVIVADGEVDPAALRRATAGQAEGSVFVLAADGGALKAEAAGVPVDLVLGDGDSLDEADRARLRASGAEVRMVAPEKEMSDTELCLREALTLGVTSVRIHGALGGRRPEHGFANVALLALRELGTMDVTIEHGASVVRLVGAADRSGWADLAGRPTDFVSLLPLAPGALGITTQGLRYPLHDEDLAFGPSRGLSNELLGTEASVTVRRGRLLVTHSRRTGVTS